MNAGLLDIIGAGFHGIGWAFLPIVLLPLATLLLPESARLTQIQTVLVRIINSVNMWLGESAKHLLIAMVVGVAFSVFALQIFGKSWTKLDESAVYFQAIVILLGSSATLLAGQHVRVDIFYAKMKPRGKVWVDIFGFYALLLPFCLIILWNMQDYVSLAWASFEGSAETDGIRGQFILKTLVSVFAISLLAQGLAIAMAGTLYLAGKPVPDIPQHISPLFNHHDAEGGL